MLTKLAEKTPILALDITAFLDNIEVWGRGGAGQIVGREQMGVVFFFSQNPVVLVAAAVVVVEEVLYSSRSCSVGSASIAPHPTTSASSSSSTTTTATTTTTTNGHLGVIGMVDKRFRGSSDNDSQSYAHDPSPARAGSNCVMQSC